MIQAARHRFDFADYLLLEEVSTVRHEFLDGSVWAMAGGSPNHARISVNVSTLLSLQLAKRPCSVFSSDLRVRVAATGLATYPDVTVVCGELELDPADKKQQTITNPTFIVEVLSPSTEDYDRSEKVAHYQRIPSLQAIVLVSHHEQCIVSYKREGAGWLMEEVRKGTLEVAGIGCSLSLSDVYRDPLARSESIEET